jgi:hypothetical protein
VFGGVEGGLCMCGGSVFSLDSGAVVHCRVSGG